MSLIDRLADLNKIAPPEAVSLTIQPPPGDANLEKFFQTVTDVQNGIRSIEQYTEDIRAKHGEALLTTDADHGRQISEELERLMEEITRASTDVKKQLQILESEWKKNQEEAKYRPAQLRIQKNQHQQLTSQFVQAMKTYQEASAQYQEKYTDQVKRRIKARYNDENNNQLSDAEVEKYAKQLLEEGKVDAIFQQSRDTLEQIRENYEDIKRIEKSMQALHQIFVDMQTMVEEQGELLDDILVNVGRSVEYVESGRRELREARKYANKSRKKICCIVVCLIIVAVAILLTLGFTLDFFK